MCVVVFVVVRGRAHWRAACSAAGCQGLNRAASEVSFRGEMSIQITWSKISLSWRYNHLKYSTGSNKIKQFISEIQWIYFIKLYLIRMVQNWKYLFTAKRLHVVAWIWQFTYKHGIFNNICTSPSQLRLKADLFFVWQIYKTTNSA